MQSAHYLLPLIGHFTSELQSRVFLPCFVSTLYHKIPILSIALCNFCILKSDKFFAEPKKTRLGHGQSIGSVDTLKPQLCHSLSSEGNNLFLGIGYHAFFNKIALLMLTYRALLGCGIGIVYMSAVGAEPVNLSIGTEHLVLFNCL